MMTNIPRMITRKDTAIPVPAPACELNWRSLSLMPALRTGMVSSGKVNNLFNAIQDAMSEATPPTYKRDIHMRKVVPTFITMRQTSETCVASSPGPF